MLLGVLAGKEAAITDTTKRLDMAIAIAGRKMRMVWDDAPHNKRCERSFARSAVLAVLARAAKTERKEVSSSRTAFVLGSAKLECLCRLSTPGRPRIATPFW